MKRAPAATDSQPTPASKQPGPADDEMRALQERARRVAGDADRIRRAAHDACSDRDP